MTSLIEEAVLALGPGELTETLLVEHIHPLFSRVLERSRDEIYLANHSLGRPLDQTEQDVKHALDLWYEKMNGAWDDWLGEIESFRRNTAALVHAPRPDNVIPKISAGQGLRAILNSYDGKVKVVTTQGEFDSIDVILKVYAQRGRIELVTVPLGHGSECRIDEILHAVDEGTALVVVSLVMFETSQVLTEIDRLVATAHEKGARVMLDLYHTAGAMPVDVQALELDFAVGGSYKYLRGGPGACWLYIHPRHLDGALATLDTGWFALAEPFAHQHRDVPQFGDGGNAFLESTPAILPFYQARAGLQFTLAIGVERLRAYSLGQQSFLIKALAEQGIEAIGAQPDHGAFVVVPHSRAGALAKSLKARHVNADARGRHLRLCPDILNTKDELYSAALRVAEAAYSI